jgi:hypothetical protein
MRKVVIPTKVKLWTIMLYTLGAILGIYLAGLVKTL